MKRNEYPTVTVASLAFVCTSVSHISNIIRETILKRCLKTCLCGKE